MSTATYKCLCCKGDFTARTADRKRGWALYCNKSCKAKKQEQRTGQYAAYKSRVESFESVGDTAYYAEDGSWDAHKSSF